MDTDTIKLPTATFTLEEVAEHFEDWRRGKRRGERIPERLWLEAIALAEHHAPSSVARRLRLSARDLNRRRATIGSGRARGEASATFVELSPAVIAQPPSPQSLSASLELIRPDGLRLRIAPGTGIDAGSVIERFMAVG
jgi:hypothetical protein